MPHELALANSEDAAIDEGAGIDDGEWNIDPVRDKADVGNDEVKFIFTAEGDDGTEVHHDGVEDKPDEVNVLGEDEAERIIPFKRDIKERGGADEVGHEPAHKEPEAKCGEAAKGKAFKEEVDEDDEESDAASHEDAEPAVLIPFRNGVGDQPASEEAEKEKEEANYAQGLACHC